MRGVTKAKQKHVRRRSQKARRGARGGVGRLPKETETNLTVLAEAKPKPLLPTPTTKAMANKNPMTPW